jgi:hypothetical protein
MYSVFTTFPARSRELRGEVDDDWGFLELLGVTRAQQASDSRDYIFALLGHPCAMIYGVATVGPDYSKSAQEFYFEVSIKIVIHCDLKVLCSTSSMNSLEQMAAS